MSIIACALAGVLRSISARHIDIDARLFNGTPALDKITPCLVVLPAIGNTMQNECPTRMDEQRSSLHREGRQAPGMEEIPCQRIEELSRESSLQGL